MVSMTTWSYSRVERLFEQLAGGELDEAKQRKRDRIVAAARELFTRHGYRRVSVDEIARHAQVAKGTIYLYFENKSALLVQAIIEEKKRYLIRVQPLLDGDMEPRERLRALIRTSYQLASEMPLISKLLEGDREMLVALDELDDNLREAMLTSRVDFLADLIASAIAPASLPTEEIRDRARLVVALLMSAAVLDPRTHHGLSFERFGELLADTVVDGIAALPHAETVERESA
jgi:AcrR family transcriptional regulator